MWLRLHRAAFALVLQLRVDRCPSLVIIEGTVGEDDRARRCAWLRRTQAGSRQERHILVDTLGLPIASRVEPAKVPDQRAGARLLAGSRLLFPAIRTVMADPGRQAASWLVHLGSMTVGGSSP